MYINVHQRVKCCFYHYSSILVLPILFFFELFLSVFYRFSNIFPFVPLPPKLNQLDFLLGRLSLFLLLSQIQVRRLNFHFQLETRIIISLSNRNI